MDTITNSSEPTVNNPIISTSSFNWYVITAPEAITELFGVSAEPYRDFTYPALLIRFANMITILDLPILGHILGSVAEVLTKEVHDSTNTP